MNDIFLFDLSMKKVGILSNDIKDACPHENAEHLENDDELIMSFQVEVPALRKETEQIEKGGYLGFSDEDGVFQLFRVIDTETVYGNDSNNKKAICEHVFLCDMDDHFVLDKRPYDVSVGVAAAGILEGQNKWELGQVAELGIASTNFYDKSGLASFVELRKTWGGAIRPRIEYNDDANQFTGFYVDILTRRGSDTGVRLEIDQDIEEFEVKIDHNVKTALIVRGAGEQTENGGYTRRKNIADVVWSTANGDPVDKPAGQEWIGDEDAREIYGVVDSVGNRTHKFGFVKFDDVTDENQLIHLGYVTLKEAKQPTFSYKITPVVLEYLPGFDHKKARLGDTIFTIVDNAYPPIYAEATIKQMKRDLSTNRKEMVVGNVMPRFTDDSARLEQIAEKVGGRSNIWDGVENPVEDTDFPDTAPPVPVVSIEGLFEKVFLHWEFEPSSYIAAYEVYGSQVQGFVPDASNLLFKGKTGGFLHAPGPDQQWYYRVRAVNTHGTESAYSVEKTGVTAKMNAENFIESLTIVNSLIKNLSADKITFGTLDGDKANIVNLKADNIVSGILDGEIINVINLNASHIISGVLNGNNVDVINLNAESVVAGILRGITVYSWQDMKAGQNLYLGHSGETSVHSNSFLYFDGDGGPHIKGEHYLDSDFNKRGKLFLVATDKVELNAGDGDEPIILNGKLMEATQQTYYACVYGNGTNITNDAAGSAINWPEKTYAVPSSIPYSTIASNRNPRFVDINSRGCMVTVAGQNTNGPVYWRGYVTV